MPPIQIPKAYSWTKREGTIALNYGGGPLDDLLAFLNVREDPVGKPEEGRETVVWQFQHGETLIEPSFHTSGRAGRRWRLSAWDWISISAMPAVAPRLASI